MFTALTRHGLAQRTFQRRLWWVGREMSSYSTGPAKHGHGECKRRKTISDLRKLYRNGTKITMLTAHDMVTATACDEAMVDCALVGDSLAMVALGYSDTTSVGMEDMLHHSRIVSRGCHTSFIIADMPYGSCQVGEREAVRNAIRFIKEGHVQAVKLEGGKSMAPTVKRIVQAGVPVMGHIGLTPQSANMLGGFRVQGKTWKKAAQLVDDALALQEAGAFGIVIEAVPAAVANHITQLINIPTIGIGAGSDVSGQVLVANDMLGTYDRFVPKFCRQFCSLGPMVDTAITQFVHDVKSCTSPVNQSNQAK